MTSNSSSIFASGFSLLDPYGFKRPQGFDFKSYDDFMQDYYKVLERRRNRWATVTPGMNHDATDGGGSRSPEQSIRLTLPRGRKLKRFVRKGVPMTERGRIWMKLSGGQELRERNPDLFVRMMELKRNPNSVLIEQISVDIPRTFPNNVNFNRRVAVSDLRDAAAEKDNDAESGGDDDGLQQSLFNVLLAFSNSNPAIGYCQGLNYVAGMLLLVTNSEEKSFWLLTAMAQNILPNYYAPNIPGLITDVKVLEELISIKCPLVSEHVKRVEMPWELVLTKWLMCLFADVLPTETALRVWDCLLYEGSKILIRVALAIVILAQDHILKANSLPDIVKQFKESVATKDVTHCHDFMTKVFALTDPLSRRQIETLRLKHGQQVDQELRERQEKLDKLRRQREAAAADHNKSNPEQDDKTVQEKQHKEEEHKEQDTKQINGAK